MRGFLWNFDAEFKFAKIQNSHVEGGWVEGGSCGILMLSSNLLKIQNSYVEGGGGSWNFDAEFKFAKIQNSHVEGGWGGSWNFDAEFKFAKIQNSHVEGGWVGGAHGNLMLSSNLLKSKIPMSGGGGGGGGWWKQLSTFDAKSKFAKKKKKKIFWAKNFLSFWAKSITVLFWTLSTKWLPYTKHRRTTKMKRITHWNHIKALKEVCGNTAVL